MIKYYPDKVCKCGCGKRIKVYPNHKYDGIPDFLPYHHNHGKNNPMYGTHRFGSANPMFGKIQKESTKQLLRNLRVGKSWGRHTQQWKDTQRKRVTGSCNPMYGKTGASSPTFGRVPSEDCIQKSRLALLGHSWEEIHGEEKAKQLKATMRSRVGGEGNPMYNKKHSPKTVQQIRETKLRKRLPEYLGLDIKSLMSKIRHCSEYIQWRSAIYKRDNFTCVICGARGTVLNADHYPKRFSDILKEHRVVTFNSALSCAELWDITKGRTVCIPCHKARHDKN